MKKTLCFALIGLGGLALDMSLSTLLIRQWAWPEASGRGFALACAVCITWLLNRQLTFARARRHSLAREFSAYQLVQLGAMGLNFMSFSLAQPYLSHHAYGLQCAIAIGSASGFVCNYLGLRHWVYREAAPRP